MLVLIMDSTGLPYCYEEAGLPAPTNCAASSSSGLASMIATPIPLGPEPPPFSGVAESCASTVAPPAKTPMVFKV